MLTSEMTMSDVVVSHDRLAVMSGNFRGWWLKYPLIPMTPPKQVWCATGIAFRQLYPYPSNPPANYHGFTRTCVIPYGDSTLQPVWVRSCDTLCYWFGETTGHSNKTLDLQRSLLHFDGQSGYFWLCYCSSFPMMNTLFHSAHTLSLHFCLVDNTYVCM